MTRRFVFRWLQGFYLHIGFIIIPKDTRSNFDHAFLNVVLKLLCLLARSIRVIYIFHEKYKTPYVSEIPLTKGIYSQVNLFLLGGLRCFFYYF